VAAKRCICGRSKAFPLCDGAHAAESWRCSARRGVRTPWCFVAGPQNENIAERLAAELGGVAAHATEPPIVAERLVALTEGYDLEHVRRLVEDVAAETRRALALGGHAGAVAAALEGWDVCSVEASGLELWPAILGAVLATARAEEAAAAPRALAPAFLSHAVADEATLLGPVGYLRRVYGAELFLCADSIEQGSVWHEAIAAELRTRPRFVLVLSSAAARSTFCAFEVGYALALGRKPALVSLDGTPPPSYVQHLQVVDLERRRAARPWLRRDEALTEALLGAVSS
jgi:hypothetical protein